MKAAAVVALSRLAFGKAYVHTDDSTVAAGFKSQAKAAEVSDALRNAKMLHTLTGRLVTVRFDWAR